MSVNVCLDDISCTAQPLLTKLGIVVYYHEAECYAERVVHCPQCQGHSKGLYNRNMTSLKKKKNSELLVHLQPNFV